MKLVFVIDLEGEEDFALFGRLAVYIDEALKGTRATWQLDEVIHDG